MISKEEKKELIQQFGKNGQDTGTAGSSDCDFFKTHFRA